VFGFESNVVIETYSNSMRGDKSSAQTTHPSKTPHVYTQTNKQTNTMAGI